MTSLPATSTDSTTTTLNNFTTWIQNVYNTTTAISSSSSFVNISTVILSAAHKYAPVETIAYNETNNGVHNASIHDTYDGGTFGSEYHQETHANGFVTEAYNVSYFESAVDVATLNGIAFDNRTGPISEGILKSTTGHESNATLDTRLHICCRSNSVYGLEACKAYQGISTVGLATDNSINIEANMSLEITNASNKTITFVSTEKTQLASLEEVPGNANVTWFEPATDAPSIYTTASYDSAVNVTKHDMSTFPYWNSTTSVYAAQTTFLWYKRFRGEFTVVELNGETLIFSSSLEDSNSTQYQTVAGAVENIVSEEKLSF